MNSSDATNIQLQNTFDESKFRDFTNIVMKELNVSKNDGKAHQLAKRLKTSPSRYEQNSYRDAMKKASINPLDISIAVN